jgi:N-formylglutamate deformylase
MPSKAEEYHLKINPKQEITRPDFCLSDVEGITCEPDFINLLVNDMGENFKKVYKNNPYFGGNVTRYLSASYKPLNNIQIEISRGIYMDENSQELIPEKAQKVKSHLTENMINHFNIFYKKYKL